MSCVLYMCLRESTAFSFARAPRARTATAPAALGLGLWQGEWEKHARLEIAGQPEVLVHDDREAPLVAPRAVVLRHGLRLRPAVLRVPVQPVVDRLHVWECRDAEFAVDAGAKSAQGMTWAGKGRSRMTRWWQRHVDGRMHT